MKEGCSGGAEEEGLEGQELGHEVCLLTQGQAALKFLVGLRSWFGLVCRKRRFLDSRVLLRV